MKKTDKSYTAPKAEIVEMQSQIHILMGSPDISTRGFTGTGATVTGGNVIDDEL